MKQILQGSVQTISVNNVQKVTIVRKSADARVEIETEAPVSISGSKVIIGSLWGFILDSLAGLMKSRVEAKKVSEVTLYLPENFIGDLELFGVEKMESMGMILRADLDVKGVNCFEFFGLGIWNKKTTIITSDTITLGIQDAGINCSESFSLTTLGGTTVISKSLTAPKISITTSGILALDVKELSTKSGEIFCRSILDDYIRFEEMVFGDLLIQVVLPVDKDQTEVIYPKIQVRKATGDKLHLRGTGNMEFESLLANISLLELDFLKNVRISAYQIGEVSGSISGTLSIPSGICSSYKLHSDHLDIYN